MKFNCVFFDRWQKDVHLEVLGIGLSCCLYSFSITLKMPLSGKKLAQDDVIKLQKEFLNCDLDGDGRISVKELEGVLNSLKKKLNVTDAEIKRVTKQIDVDSDGTINLREYYDTMTNTTNKNLIHRALVARSKIRKQFEKYDTDGDECRRAKSMPSPMTPSKQEREDHE